VIRDEAEEKKQKGRIKTQTKKSAVKKVIMHVKNFHSRPTR
jgi:hypothetical protein